MELNLSLPYGFDYILHCVMLSILCKLLIVMVPRVGDVTTWVSELYYRIEGQLRHVRGIEVFPGINDRWLFVDIWILLINMIAIQQLLILLEIVGTFRWNSILDHILKFHQLNTDFPCPKIANELLGGTHSYVAYLHNILYINLATTTTLWSSDIRLENWRRTPAGYGFCPYYFAYVVFGFYLTTALFSTYIIQATKGFEELELILEYSKTQIFPIVKVENYTIYVTK